MNKRLADSELAFLENTIAITLRIQARVRRLVYEVDDPDVLADLVGLTADAARIRQLALDEKSRRHTSEK